MPGATYPMKLACLIAIAANSGHPFICGICGEPILPGQKYAFDHGHASARGGPNTVANLFPVHDEKPGQPFDCHTMKTAHPRGPHTAIGGDTHESSKTDTLAEEHALHLAILAGTAERPVSRLRSRGFQKRPEGVAFKLPSRPFGRSAVRR